MYVCYAVAQSLPAVFKSQLQTAAGTPDVTAELTREPGGWGRSAAAGGGDATASGAGPERPVARGPGTASALPGRRHLLAARPSERHVGEPPGGGRADVRAALLSLPFFSRGA
ncbi:Hypothetical protein NTJ_04501 [Nesidiocoris tenuis]|uniref:Uncharacterized protein n=1 Tax=Nesidiocoris tenuis TaxID=355587 RepID=A0ABN7AK85_9HEMI|nr:Hypothetical protein NTJ_04501 [Nesidiocoris tenuis]